jgi:hypothetical protein
MLPAGLKLPIYHVIMLLFHFWLCVICRLKAA